MPHSKDDPKDPEWRPYIFAREQWHCRICGDRFQYSETDREGRASLAALAKRLKEWVWTNERNVRLDIRWGAGDAERYRQYALELVALAPDVLLANTSPVLAALQRATRTVPIVFVGVSWPLSDRAATTRDAAASLNASALYRLMAWLSPAYPIGAF